MTEISNYIKVAIFVVLSLEACIVSTCFITNCPVGGKRNSDGVNIKLKPYRQCMVCGPKGSGHCYGPQICCGPNMGCHINSRDTFVCQMESAYPVPCENKGAGSCGNNFDGRCAADGVCCSTDQCVLDESCNLLESGIVRNSMSSDYFPFRASDVQHALSNSANGLK